MKKIQVLKHQFEFLDKFLNSNDWAHLFIGGFGSGKSYTLSVTALTCLIKHPGINIGVYSVTYDLLKLVSIPQIEARLQELNLKYTLNKSDMIFQVKNYGQIIMRSLDNPGRIIGYEHAFGLIDELDTLPKAKASTAWNMVAARNRQNIKGDINKIGVYTTPEGFNFCYDRFEKNRPEGYTLTRSKTEENTFLPPSYVQNLRSTYPEQLIDAYLNGEFVNLNGNQVYYAFDRFACNTEVTTKDFLDSDKYSNINAKLKVV